MGNMQGINYFVVFVYYLRSVYTFSVVPFITFFVKCVIGAMETLPLS